MTPTSSKQPNAPAATRRQGAGAGWSATSSAVQQQLTGGDPGTSVPLADAGRRSDPMVRSTPLDLGGPRASGTLDAGRWALTVPQVGPKKAFRFPRTSTTSRSVRFAGYPEHRDGRRLEPEAGERSDGRWPASVSSSGRGPTSCRRTSSAGKHPKVSARLRSSLLSKCHEGRLTPAIRCTRSRQREWGSRALRSAANDRPERKLASAIGRPNLARGAGICTSHRPASKRARDTLADTHDNSVSDH
jgi:hypothetical protein